MVGRTWCTGCEEKQRKNCREKLASGGACSSAPSPAGGEIEDDVFGIYRPYEYQETIVSASPISYYFGILYVVLIFRANTHHYNKCNTIQHNKIPFVQDSTAQHKAIQRR